MSEHQLKELVEKYSGELDEPFDDIYDQLGFNVLYYIVKEFGGTYLYVPKASTVFKNCVFARIREEYNGFNCKKLAIKYSVSETTVRNIVN